MIQLLLALLQKEEQSSNLATSHNKSFRRGRGLLVPGRRLSRSTVSTAAPSEACSGSSARTPGTSPSARTQKKVPVRSARCEPHLPGRQQSFLAVLSPWFPHPLQEAGAHLLRRLQATLQVLEEDPEQGEKMISVTACLGALRASVRAHACVCVCVCLACCETGKSPACFQTGHPSGCAEQQGGGWTWTGPPSPPCSPERRGKEGEWMEDGGGTRR